MSDDLVTGRDPATPFRLLARVALVVFAVVAVVAGAAYALWSVLN